jgi:hypothetical protein
MWPRPNPGNMSLSSFDPARFWVHGGPLFFGDKISGEVTSGRDVTSVLHCHCEIQMESTNDDEVRQMVLYHLNIAHASAEIKEMDRLQFPLDFEKRWNQGHLSAIFDMTDMWGPCRDGGVKSGFFEDKKAWISWLCAARIITMDWEGFDDWDWEGFKDVKGMAINKKLSLTDFRTLTVRILIFFIKTFVTRLGYYPSPMLCPPILANPCCTKHQKKFATRLF